MRRAIREAARKGVDVASDYRYVTVCTQEAEDFLCELTLENKGSTGPGYFGKICWDTYERLHPEIDWETFKTYSWMGGGFGALPSVEDTSKGMLLFISETQERHLDEHLYEFVCYDTSSPKGEGQPQYYLNQWYFDEIVVIPDSEVERAIAARAAKEAEEAEGKAS